jgi:hypothetical protein
VQGALRLVKPAQASLPYCSHWPVEPDVVTLSSSDTEEALELLPLSPGCGVSSRLLGGVAQEPWSSSGSDLFEDLHKANDIAVSIYVASTAEASSTRALMANVPHGKGKSRPQSSSTQ